MVKYVKCKIAQQKEIAEVKEFDISPPNVQQTLFFFASLALIKVLNQMAA